MAKRERVILAGVFRDVAQANRAVHELRRVGFRGGLVEVVIRDDDTSQDVPAKKPKTARVTRLRVNAPRKRLKSGRGPSSAVASGGLIEGLVEAAAAATELIPGVGPELAADLVEGVLGDPPGVRGKLSALGFGEDDVSYFDRRVAAGEALVVVRANARHRQAATVLRRCGVDEPRRSS